ncbi:hypothetical protein AVEN_259961-1 [Araneus ventricosus]|uniref:Mos1 transposase HTH domain-containing protein n=1 Tax=Araneus ventricosus TaxID=182803 RepID=A0A4Y2JC62_ARAVE|nr:hypothetical protein AVEN_259961-1 [Araneus ventricosus]
MVSSSFMTISILLAKLKNYFKSSSHPPYSPELPPNLGSKRLSGTRFSSNSDVKTAAENLLNGQGRVSNEAWLNKLVLRSDKCLNGFGDYMEN